MFSACSLRSTQCAALIALAAAAGIARIETAEMAAKTIDTRGQPIAQVRSVAASRLARDGSYHFSAFASVRWLQSAASTLIALFAPQHAAAAQDDATDTGHAGSPMPAVLLAADSTIAVPPPAIAGTVTYFSFPVLVPRERDHAWPYAVGPPARGIENLPLRRVAGTAVPCDSTPRWSCELSVSRIAFVSVARSVRALSAGPELAAPISLPSLALRGESEISARCSHHGFAVSAPDAHRVGLAFFLA